MAVSVMTKIDALGKECARKPVSWQPMLFEANFTVARDKTNNGVVVITVKRSTSAKAPTMTRKESVAREDVATLRTKYDTGRDFSPLKHWPHPVLSPSSHLLQLLLSSYVSMTRTRSSENWHASRTTRSILRIKLLKIASIRFAFRAIDYASERRRTTEQVAEDCQLQTATKSQVGRRHMRTRL